RGVRSDLLEQFRRARDAATDLPNYAFEDSTLYETHRAPVRWIRRLLNPILKLFFNPNPLIQALHIQSQLNTYYAERRRMTDELYYELIHNLVVEMTKLGIETKNLKMRLESIASRLEFNERRARALESVVVYKPANERESVYDAPPAPAPVPQAQPPAPPPVAHQHQHQQGGSAAEGPGQRSRRRRRRRGRRGGGAPGGPMPPQNRPDDRGAAAPSAGQGTPPAAGDSHVAAAESVQHALAAESQPAESTTQT